MLIGSAPEELATSLAACAAGDRTALRRIYDLEAGRLIAVAERILRRRELAEEVVQETFIRIWTHARQYDPDRGSARGWIYAIVRNRALNLLRDGAREYTVEEVEALHETETSDHVIAAWHRLDRNSRLYTCLHALEEKKKRGILMAYVGGYSHG